MDSETFNITKIKDGFFLGDEQTATNYEVLFSFKISHIINAAGPQIRNAWENLNIKYLTLNWNESPNQYLFDPKDEIANRIVSFIDDSQKQGEGFLVHSVRGQDRACLVVLIYFIRKFRWSLRKSLEFLTSKKSDIDIPIYFSNQLSNYETRLTKAGLGPKSNSWSEVGTGYLHDIDNEEVMIRNTYLNGVVSASAEDFFSFKSGQNKKNYLNRLLWQDQTDKRVLINPSFKKDLFLMTPKEIRPVINHHKMEPVKSCIKGSNNNIKKAPVSRPETAKREKTPDIKDKDKSTDKSTNLDLSPYQRYIKGDGTPTRIPQTNQPQGTQINQNNINNQINDKPSSYIQSNNPTSNMTQQPSSYGNNYINSTNMTNIGKTNDKTPPRFDINAQKERLNIRDDRVGKPNHNYLREDSTKKDRYSNLSNSMKQQQQNKQPSYSGIQNDYFAPSKNTREEVNISQYKYQGPNSGSFKMKNEIPDFNTNTNKPQRPGTADQVKTTASATYGKYDLQQKFDPDSYINQYKKDLNIYNKEEPKYNPYSKYNIGDSNNYGIKNDSLKSNIVRIEKKQESQKVLSNNYFQTPNKPDIRDIKRRDSNNDLISFDMTGKPGMKKPSKSSGKIVCPYNYLFYFQGFLSGQTGGLGNTIEKKNVVLARGNTGINGPVKIQSNDFRKPMTPDTVIKQEYYNK